MHVSKILLVSGAVAAGILTSCDSKKSEVPSALDFDVDDLFKWMAEAMK